jgi:hypothetical protein
MRSDTVRFMNFWESALNWEIALDGWIGAVLGAVASVGVAAWVLRRTLKHEREQFLEQLESERRLAIEQRRLEAFGDVAGQLRRLQTLPDHEEARAIFAEVSMAVARWRMYLRGSARHGLALESLVLAIVSAALVRGVPGTPEAERSSWSKLINNAVLRAVEDGLGWHLGDIDEEDLTRRWQRLREDVAKELPEKLPSAR